MKSRDAVATIVRHRADALIVSTMTAIKWLDQIDKDGLNVACVPLMGGASALGVGIALAQPGRNVFVLDGDGSLLMQLPSLVMTCEAAPPNFVHFVFNNGVWFENLANIPTPGSGRVDFSGLARGAGYQKVVRATTSDELDSSLRQIVTEGGPTFVELMIEPEATGLWNQSNTQPDLADVHFTRLGAEIRQMRAKLGVS